MKKIFKIFIIGLIIIAVNSNIKQVCASSEYDNIQGVDVYDSKDGVPDTIRYNNKILTKRSVREIDYNESISFAVKDYCRWYPPNMAFYAQEGWIPWSKVVSKDNHTFEVNLRVSEYLQHITPYAAPEYEVRGHSTYDGYSVIEEPWIGNNNVSFGESYHTATHYYKGAYARNVYFGIYDLIYPKYDWAKPEGANYIDSSKKEAWYKLNSQIGLRNKYHEDGLGLAKVYFYLDKYNGTRKIDAYNNIINNSVVTNTVDQNEFSIDRVNLNSGYTKSREQTLFVTAKTEGDYIYRSQAYSNVGYWANDNAKAIDSNWKVRIDAVGPSIITNENNIWNKSLQEVTFSAIDKRSGCKSIAVYKNLKIMGSGTDRVKVNEDSEGINTYLVVATDNVGNVTRKNVIVKIDKTGPGVKFNPGESGWSNKNINVDICTSDNLSGVSKWRYCTSRDGGATWSGWSNYISSISGTVTVSNEGNNRIKVEALDKAGNTSTTVSGIYKIDKTGPGVKFNPGESGWSNKNINVDICTSDNLSGVSKWRYCTSRDGGATWSGWSNYISSISGTVTVSNEGSNRIKIEAVDKVGNTSTTVSGIYKIDKTPPEIFGTTVYGWSRGTITINLAAKDNGCGINSIELVDACNTRVASGTSSFLYTVKKEGVNIYKAIAKDKVGNTTYRYVIAKIDNVAPKGKVEYNYEDNTDLTIDISKVIENESGIKDIYVEYMNSNLGSKAISKKMFCKKKLIDNRADLDGNGIVDINDLALLNKSLGSVFGMHNYNSQYDLNEDGAINQIDVNYIKKNIGGEYQFEEKENLKNLLGECLYANIKIIAIDKVGNERILDSKKFAVDLKPRNDEIKVEKYDYKQNDTTYWINKNNYFIVKTGGYFPYIFGEYPEKTFLKLSSESELQSIGSADIEGYYKNDNFNNNFETVGELKAFKLEEHRNSGIVNKLECRHSIKPGIDGESYKLYVSNSYAGISSEYSDSGIYVKIDGTPPIADHVSIKKQEQSELVLEIENLRDVSGENKEGSGIKNIYVEYQPINFVGEKYGKVEKSNIIEDLGGGNFRIGVRYEDGIYKDVYGKFSVKVCSEDNVGNKSVLYDEIVDRVPLTIDGSIDSNPCQAGQVITLNILTTGNAKKIRVTFPGELEKISDEVMSVEKEILVEPKHVDKINSRIPISAEQTIDNNDKMIKSPYKVYIEAENEYGDTVGKYLDLYIKGSILDGIHVEMRGTGYDK